MKSKYSVQEKLEWMKLLESGRTVYYISKNSTIAALNVLRLIKNATFVEMDIPQSNKQKKTFQFIFVFILKSYLIGYGDVKILVGVQEIGRFLHYSVTIQ